MDPDGSAASITADEIALYDRQIRLWGLQAQESIRNAHVLLITMKALGNEVAKNLVLAGIGSLTISDPALVTEDDLGAQFFISEEDVGKARADAARPSIQKLNKRVNVSSLAEDPFTAADDPSSFQKYTLVLATDLPIAGLNKLNAACRVAGVPFYAAASHGLYGYLFADLIQHTFSIERDRPNVATVPGTFETPTRTIVSSTMKTSADGKRTELVTKQEMYQPLILANSSPLPPAYLKSPRKMRQVPMLLPCLRALWDVETTHGGRGPVLDNKADLALFTKLTTEKCRELQLPFDMLKGEFLRRFLQNAYLELAPTAAFVGAAMAQDVINVLGKREQPIQNMLLFDGEEGKGEILALYPMVTTADASL